MSKSKIEWTDETWNPVTGCSKVSAGCKNCYAERDWARVSNNPKMVQFRRKFTDVQCHYQRLIKPLRWKKPRKIFVNSISDLFHHDVPDEFLDQVFDVISKTSQHTFQILTKRAERMHEYFQTRLVPKNVWLGVSVENQETANERIPFLLQTHAAVRWISAEPLLEAIELMETDGLNWVVVGGESGPRARPMHPDWVRSLRDQCKEANIPFMFKQWGEWAIDQLHIGGDLGRDLRSGIVQHLCLDRENDGHFRKGDVHMRRVGKKTAGRLLDGQLHDEYPEVNHA